MKNLTDHIKNNGFDKVKQLLFTLLFGGLFMAVAQTPGIPYQAYIIDTNGGYVPGEQIEVPLANAKILLQFEIRDDKGEVEYRERIPVTTDEYGLVSTVIGIEGNGGTPVFGSFSDIDWNGKQKRLYIDIDFSGAGDDFVDHGDMDIIYIPGPASGVITNETTSTLKYNGDGSYTYTDEDGTKTTFSTAHHVIGDGNPNTLGKTGNVGDIYVDQRSGELFMYGGDNWVSINSGGGRFVAKPNAPTLTEPADPKAGDIYVNTMTGDIYTYNDTTKTWKNQSATLANNGLLVDQTNTVQLGGALITPTVITTDATNTLALTGLQDADNTTDNSDVVVVNQTTGALQKMEMNMLNVRQYVSEYTALRGDDEFDTPQNILKLENINAYRNGVRIDFIQIDNNTIKLDLAETAGCYAGDVIRIVQLQ